MIPTKTYPLSAIIGEELTDKERIAELADAFNMVCDENADFVAESIKDETRIAELQNAFEDAVTRAEKAENRLAELEAEVKTLREALIDMRSGWKYIREMHGDLYGVGWDRAQDKADAALAATLRLKGASNG
jgi:predicted  nucleic acid-binding Zn-ribbon protein